MRFALIALAFVSASSAFAANYKYDCLCPRKQCGGAERLRVALTGNRIQTMLADIEFEVSEDMDYRVSPRSPVNPVRLQPARPRGNMYLRFPILWADRELFTGGKRYPNGQYGAYVVAAHASNGRKYGRYSCIRVRDFPGGWPE